MVDIPAALPAGDRHNAGRLGHRRAARTSAQITASTHVQAAPPAARFILRGGAPVMTAAGNALGLTISQSPCRAVTNTQPGAPPAAGAARNTLPASPSSASGSELLTADSALEPPNQALSALWLGPDEQLLLGPDGADLATALQVALRDLPHSLVEVSHRQIALHVTGPHAATLLNAGCPLDLDLSVFPVGMCTRTVLAKAEIVLWRTAANVFHIEVWRSFAPYVSGFLAEAARELIS